MKKAEDILNEGLAERPESLAVLSHQAEGGGESAGEAGSVSEPGCFEVLGLPIRATFPEEAGDYLLEVLTALRKTHSATTSGPGAYVCFTTVHGLMECHDDPDLGEIYRRALLAVPDGMPLVWWAHAVGHRRTRRVYGPDFLLHLLGRTVHRGGFRHFFCGGQPGVAEEMVRRLLGRFPALSVAGILSPPFHTLNEAEQSALAAELRQSGADFVWVGLGTPKQDRFMARMAREVPAIFLGVGAAFDIHAGRQPEPPGWVQRSGLQWLFRLIREPRRLARRYLWHNPRFIWLALRAALKPGARRLR